MPLLSYSAITDYPFAPFTKIYSADVNLMFSTIQTLLNTTKLDSANVQAHGLIRQGATSNIASGIANQVVINDVNGDFSSEAQLAITRGGLGADLTPNVGNSGQSITVNAAGNGFVLANPGGVAGAIFNYYNFS